MKVVTKRPSEAPVVQDMDTITLEDLQGAVGGWIETAVEGDGFMIFCNEEGRIYGLAPNFVRPFDGEVIVGPVIAVGMDDEGMERGLSTDEVLEVVQLLEGRTNHSSE